MVSASEHTSSRVGDCQRFYGFGKKIPKDVKRHCGMCRQHGITVETRGHTCEFKNCDCRKCKLIRQRRSIMSTQIRLRREQDKKFQRTTDVSEADVVPWSNEDEKEKHVELNMCYFCQKCKNHGVLMWKKDHKKNCQYMECRCEQCDLIDTRRALDRHIKSDRVVPKNASTTSSSEVSSSSSPCDVQDTVPALSLLSLPSLPPSPWSPYAVPRAPWDLPLYSPLFHFSSLPITFPPSFIYPFGMMNPIDLQVMIALSRAS